MSKVLVLRTCNPDFTSYNGFQWPATGHVSAPDWIPSRECGNGLHGFLWGEGDGTLADWNGAAVWQVIEVNNSDIVNLRDKVKFKEGNVVFSGSRQEATNIIIKNAPRAVKCIGATIIVGDCETAVVGDCGTAEAGDCGTAVAGDFGVAVVGEYGTATAGSCGIVEAGNYGTAKTGDYGNAVAGDCGTAVAGYGGTAIVGRFGNAAAGKKGTIKINGKLGKIGENGLLPHTYYYLDENGNFVQY